jgi:hypothetical protein
LDVGILSESKRRLVILGAFQTIGAAYKMNA